MEKDNSPSGVLPDKPKKGTTYEMQLHLPVKIDVYDTFWMLFICSESTPVEMNNSIKNFTLCSGNLAEDSEIDHKNARFSVEITDVLDLDEALLLPKTEENSTSLGLTEIANLAKPAGSVFYRVEPFEFFDLISIYNPNFVPPGYLEEVGSRFIIEKKEGKHKIIYCNVWNHIHDYWLLLNEELTEEKVNNYGLSKNINSKETGSITNPSAFLSKEPVWLLFQFGKMNLAYPQNG